MRAPSPRRLTLLLGALSAIGPLSIDMYLPSFPSVARALGTSVAAVQLTLATYLAGLAMGQLAYGPLSDRFGRRAPLLAGLALYAAAGLACAAAPSLAFLAAARFVQALGGCAGLVIARAVVRDRFDVRDSARLYASLMLVMGAAPILAPLLGGQLLLLGGWRAIFGVLAAAGLALAAMVALGLPETLPRERRQRHGPGEIVRALGEALSHGPFVRLSLAGGAVQAAMFAYIAGSPFVLIELFGIPPARFGLVFGANAFGIIAASQLSRFLAARRGVMPPLRAGVAAAVVGYGALFAAVHAGGGLWLVLPGLFLGVASYGLVAPSATAAAMEHFEARAGSASAVLGVLQSTAGALAATAVSGLADGTARPLAGVTLACALLAAALLWAEGVSASRRRAGTPG
ncbi:multidrug effflux MFS transporter [Anaeromyxobacter paludicola]|uniref:Bcr/CflA family drug resistance efflux transporter n=1 Tax=Anaeromyxobacter paludicola TaxID=2918171 RepID=A0ABM7XEA9_9BACT|nr:multidrug effflux MFS transporter [Anaeromyxobacter paludicola]BDG10199.1 Bcr/CflA family drug resistance efflux transporter [Anaeromyxobacter paludicola]